MRFAERRSTMIREARTLSVSIGRRPGEVYAFVREMRNLPRWAKGLCKAVRQVAGRWMVETPEGEVEFAFVKENELGVLDHVANVSPGVEVYVPMRVVANAEGSEVTLTVFRMEGMTDEAFARDVGMVERDLAGLKAMLEQA
jgi:hypothetical protein